MKLNKVLFSTIRDDQLQPWLARTSGKQAQLFFLLFTFLFTLNLGAQVPDLTIEDATREYQIAPHVQVLMPPLTHFSRDSMLQGYYDHLFLPLSGLTSELQSHQDYWAKVTVRNRLEKTREITDWVMHFPLILTDIEVCARYEAGDITTAKSGFFIPFHERTFHPTHKRNLIKIQLPPGESVDLFIKAKCERNGLPPSFNASMSRLDRYFTEMKNRKQADGVFSGFVLMILIYNLFIFFFNKDKAFVYYSGYLLSILLFSLYNTGDLVDLLGNSIFSQNPRLTHFIKISAYLFIITYLTFLRVFLRLPQLLPKWDTIFKRFLLWFVLPAALLESIMMVQTQFNYNRIDTISIITILIFLVMTTIFFYPLYKTRDKKGYFIIAGFLAMEIGILLTIYDRYQTIEFSTLPFKVGTILEIIIYSIGLVYRQQEKEKERQQATFDLQKSQILQQQKAQEAAHLAEINRLKTDFYTNITHEFRTPLTVIMGMAENIHDHPTEKEMIIRNSHNLLGLINQLLDLSKLDGGYEQIHYLQADIVPLLRYLTESFYSLAKEKNIDVHFSSSEDTIVMDFDETKIQHIINNLMSNAVKFTKPGGKIDCHVSCEIEQGERYLEIKIKDTGIGISAEHINRIFDRFYQVKDNRAVGFGTGIGLALCKELTSLLGGKIYVESTLGKGAIFVVRLPISQQAVKYPVNIVKPLASHTTPALPMLPPTIHDPNQPIVLVIEDNKDVAYYVQSLLTKEYQVELATDGLEGVKKALELIPDIIITDVMMPKKDGYEVTQILKNDTRTSHIPIIILTAKANEKDKLDGLQAGADAYLPKPFNKEELRLRLENMIRLKKEIQTQYGSEWPTGQALVISKKDEKTATGTKAISLDEQFVQQIQNEIEKRLDDSELSIADLCTATGLSHSQLYRKLKALTGHTPVHFIRTYRLQKARVILGEGRYNVSEVAYQVGFNDPNYFSRAFIQEFGIPPSELKK